MTIRKKITSRFQLFKTVLLESIDDNIFKLAAALAYYTLFSLVPMLIIVIWVTGIFYDPSLVTGELLTQMNKLLGPDAVKQIQEVMNNTRFDSSSGWARTLGVVTLILSAMGIFTEIQDSINTIWGLKAKPEKGFLKLLINRLSSFSMLISLGFILTVSLLVNAFIAALIIRIQYYFPGSPVMLFYIINQGLIFLILLVLFASVFKVLPDAHISWKHVRSGAFITALLFMGGKYLIGYYLGQNATITAYGSAGSVIIILLWIYFSAIILFFGAEYTQATLKVKGLKIQPNKYAIWVDEKAIPVKSNTEVHKENIPH